MEYFIGLKYVLEYLNRMYYWESEQIRTASYMFKTIYYDLKERI